MSIRVTGIQEAVKALEDYKDTKTERLQSAVDESVINVERKAKKKITSDGHIVTGRLRASIHGVATNSQDTSFNYSDQQGNSFEGSTDEGTGKLNGLVVTNVDYGPKIEALDSFMFYGWEQERPEFIKLVKKILSSIR